MADNSCTRDEIKPSGRSNGTLYIWNSNSCHLSTRCQECLKSWRNVVRYFCLILTKIWVCWQISVKRPNVKCSWKSVLQFPSCFMHMYKEEFSRAICRNERVPKNCQTSLLSLHFWTVDVCRNIFDLNMFQHIYVLVHLTTDMAFLHSAMIPNVVHMSQVAYLKDFWAYRILSQTIILFKDINWIITKMFPYERIWVLVRINLCAHSQKLSLWN